MAEADKAVADMGFELDENTVRAKYGEGWKKKSAPAPVAPTVHPGLPAGGPPANFAEGSATAGDEIDAAVRAELAGWRPMLDPLVEPLQAFLDDAARRGLTASEVLEQLPQVLSRMDDAALMDALTRLSFASRASATTGAP